MRPFILGPRGRAPILHTIIKIVPMSLEKKFPVNPVESYFAKIHEDGIT